MASTSSSFGKTSSEEVVNHYGSTRLRVKGIANLWLTLFSLDEIKISLLKQLPIKSKTAVEPTRISNFTQQRAKLEIRTTEINETFQVSKIILFVKPVAKSLPQSK